MKYIFVLTILFFLCGQFLSSEEPLVFSAIADSIDSEISGQILIEAYDRIGIDIEIKEYPGVRALQYSNNGITDGEVNRVGGIEKMYENLIPVPVALSEIVVVAFTTNPDIKITKLDDIGLYRVGIRRGAKFAEELTRELDQSMVYSANTELKLYKMLASNRVDLIIAPEKSYLFVQKALMENIFYPSPALNRLPLYHYLHKDNKVLISEITQILEEMRDEGRIDEIKDLVLLNRFK